MIVSGADFGLVLLVAIGAYLMTGIAVGRSVRDAYAQIGHGKFALDVPDRIAPAPPNSPAGQAEVQQLLDAIEAVRREHDERQRE